MPSTTPSKDYVSERLNVLVVEDDRNYRLILHEILSSLSFFSIEKTFALNASEALEKFNDIRPDVVLLDIHLPDGKGLDLIQPMLKIHPSTAILMVTGSNTYNNVKTARQHGAIGYILKPYKRMKIQQAFHSVMLYRTQYLANITKNMTPQASAAMAADQLYQQSLPEKKRL